jgi:lysophospholipase L1-like esterase
MTISRLLTLTVLLAPLTLITSTAAEAGPWCNQIVIIGDSLTAQGNGRIHAALPAAIVNARGGRTVESGYEAAVGVNESNVSDCWIFALGTNDIYQQATAEQITARINQLLTVTVPTDHIWWIMPAFGPGSTLDGSQFAALLPAYAAIKIVPAIPANEYQPDGIHLTDAGYQRRAAQIVDAIAQ